MTCLIIATFSQVRQYRYQEAVKSGNTYYERGDYINAKVAFQLALRMKAGDEYALEMITVTLDLIKGQSEKRKRYSDFLVQADQDFRNLKLQLARSSYQQALTLFLFEKYPKKQIERIDLIILENQEIIRDNEAAIIEGDHLFAILSYEDAKIEFQYALGLIPGQEYAKQRLRELRRIMTGLDEANLEVKKAISLSNTLLAQRDTLGAKAALENVLQLEPLNTQAQKQLNQINASLSDSKRIEDLINKAEAFFAVDDLFNAERTYRDALMLNPENNILRSRLKDIEQAISEKRTTPLEDYENAIREGNKLMLEGKTEEAKEFYYFAARLRPTAQNPLADSTQFAQQSIIDQLISSDTMNYDSIVNEALKQLKSNNLTSSLALLRLADSLKQIDPSIVPTLLQDSIQNVINLRSQTITAFDQYLVEARNLINSNRLSEARLAYENTQRVRADFDLNPQQIILSDELRELLAQKERIALRKSMNYNTVINEALIQLEANNLTSSLSLLQLADSLKQIDPLIGNTLLQDSIQNVINLRSQTKTAFDQYLVEARNLLNSNRLSEARLAIENAQRISADFDLNSQQSNLLDDLNESLSQKEQIANLIEQASEYQLKGNFLDTQKSYQEALALDPNSLLITQRLLEIQRLLDDEEARNIFLYNQALTEAERLLTIGDFNAASLQLHIADSLHLKQLPILARYNKLDSLYQIQLLEGRKRYDALIVNADYYYRAREYDKALQAYVDARELLPFEKYPQDMIARITNQFSSKSLQTISEGSTEISNRGVHRINFEPIDISERNDIYFHIQLKNVSKIKNLKVIFNYGRDGQKNGGVIVRLVESDETTDYLVRVGNQYRWFSEDNNWISLQAEGGNIDLLFCKITKAE